MSQINSFLERLASILVGVNVPGLPNPYILAANPYQPSDIASAQCPFWILELNPSGGTSNLPVGDGAQRRSTVVDAVLCVQRREGNIDLKYSVHDTAEWVDACYATMAQHVRLSAPAVTILSSTNASPIKVTTAIPHGYANGSQVTIANVLVNTNANGAWNTTVIDDLNFTIPAVGNGIGGQTGTARLTQPFDMSNIVDAWIANWGIVDYVYGSSSFIALLFKIVVREFYLQPNMSA